MVTNCGSNPAVRPYRYEVGFIDMENRVFTAGDYHQTIHLTIGQGVGGSWNLNWTPYTGFDYSSYNILRKTGSGSYEQIATISNSFNSFTDFNAPRGDVSYILAIDRPGVCNTILRDNGYLDVRSTVASLNPGSVAGSEEVNFIVYPVPANGRISVQFGDNTNEMVRLTITDVTGRILYSGEYSDLRTGQVHSISTSGFEEGFYLLNVISAGSKSTRKIVVRH